MRILVTGGAGFIGSHFVKRLLLAGDDVVVLDKLTYSGNRANLPPNVEFHEGDIAAKAAGDLLIPAYVRTFDVDASITRGSNTYGPNQYPEKFIPLFVTNAFDGEALPLYGDGKQVRDWLFVEDHCAGIELVLREGSAGEIYNVGGSDERENIEVAERIIELTGADRSLLRSVPDRPGHDRRYSLDTTKLRGLGW